MCGVTVLITRATFIVLEDFAVINTIISCGQKKNTEVAAELFDALKARLQIIIRMDANRCSVEN